jgi:hypothetical protein
VTESGEPRGVGPPGEPPDGQTHDEPAPPGGASPRSRRSKNWLPWIVIVAVVLVALAIALPLTLGGSSSSASPTPPAPSTTANGATPTDVSGSFFTQNVVGSRLMFLSLTRAGAVLSGHLAITQPGVEHKHLVTHTYAVTGSVSNGTIHLTVAPDTTGSYTVAGTYQNGTLSLQLSQTVTVSLKRGTLAQYKLLVRQQRKTLLGS